MKHLMPKSLICLSAVLLVLLCACQQTQPDNVIFPPSDQPSPVFTVQVSAMPDQPGPVEQQAVSLTTAQEDELYDMVLNSIVYMFTNGGRDVGPYGASGSGYRFDVDGDGTQDWVVGNSDLYWLICSGGREGFSCYAFPNGNASVTVYGSDKSQLVVQRGNGTASALWDSISVFREGELKEALSTTTHFLNEETYTFYDVGTEPVDYMVGGKLTDKSEYDNATTALGKLTRLGLTPFQFVRSTTLGPSQLQSAAALLEALPFCSEMLTADVNGDGVEDCGLFLAAHDSLGPEGVTVTYETGSGIQNGWSGCCLVLLSSDYCVGAKVLGSEEARKLFQSAAVSDAVENSAPPALADGEYDVDLYFDGLQDTEEGVYGYVDVKKEITFSDQYVSALSVGGVLDLSQYGYDSLSIRTMERQDYAGVQEMISFGDGEMRLFRDYGSSTWRLAWSHDAWVTYTSEQVSLLFAEDAVIVDDINMESARLGSVREFFIGPYVIDSAAIHVTVQNGRVTEAIRYFVPQL